MALGFSKVDDPDLTMDFSHVRGGREGVELGLLNGDFHFATQNFSYRDLLVFLLTLSIEARAHASAGHGGGMSEGIDF